MTKNVQIKLLIFEDGTGQDRQTKGKKTLFNTYIFRISALLSLKMANSPSRKSGRYMTRFSSGTESKTIN